MYDLYGRNTTLYTLYGSLIGGTKKRYKTFSVLSDSFSAIDGGVTPSTNAVFYPSTGNDVTSISQMWWYLFSQSYGCQLVRNNAFSGSRVADDPEWYAGVENCFIGRSSNLGNPDLILVLGGTNDVWNKIPLGEYVYSDWTDADKQTYRGGLAYLLHKIKSEHPKAKVLYLCNVRAMYTDQNGWPEEYKYYVSTHEICDHMDVQVEDINMDVQGNHPSVHGMRQIRDVVMDALGENPIVINRLDTSGFNSTMNVTWSPADNSANVGKIETGELYKVSFNVNAIGSDDAYVYVSVTGTNTAEFAKFEKFKGKTGRMSMIVEASSYANSENATLKLSVTGSTRTATVTEFKVEHVTWDK